MEDDLDQEFIQEANELFEQTEEALLEMEAQRNSEDNYKTSMRCLHTLKGAFGMFGLGELENASHHFEDLLKYGHTHQCFSKDLADYLLQGLDSLKNSLNQGKKLNYQLLEIEQIQSPPQSRDKSIPTPVKIPVQAQAKKENEKPYISKPVIKKDPAIGTVFVIEDEDDIRNFMVKKLNLENIETHDFDDALEALKNISSLKPDLIITDLKMPKMSGMEFITELRKNHIQIPVIIASAYVTKENCIEALSHGASGIIEKPFQTKDLINMARINIMRYRSYKLLNQSLRHMQFQFSDLINFLTEIGQHERCEFLQTEFQTILAEKRKLDTFKV